MPTIALVVSVPDIIEQWHENVWTDKILRTLFVVALYFLVGILNLFAAHAYWVGRYLFGIWCNSMFVFVVCFGYYFLSTTSPSG